MTYLPEKGRLGLPMPYGDDAQLAKHTLRQLEKDFALQGFNLILPDMPPAYPELLTLIATFLKKHDLLHSEAFVRLLYQLDIREPLMKQLIADTAPQQIYERVAHEMLLRCFQKVVFRQQFSHSQGQNPSDAP